MKTIMVVDDEPDLEALVRQKFRRQIREGEFSFVFARDGVEALEAVARHPQLDLLLADINMPRMDGFTFIRTIRAQDAYKDIPIIVLSTEGQEKDIQTGMSLGANLYMVKPAQPEKMVRNIKMLLG